MKRCVFLLLISFWCLKALAWPDGVVVFGDSLSDQGNNFWIEDAGRSGAGRGAPITNRPKGASVKSSGKIWFEHVAQELVGSRPVSSSVARGGERAVNSAWAAAETGLDYLDDKAGVPFPVADACTAPGYVEGRSYSCVPGVMRQIELYLAKHTEPLDQRVFILVGGGNDVIDNIRRLSGWLDDELHQLFRWVREDKSRAGSLLADEAGSGFHQKFSKPVVNTVKAVELLIRRGVPEDNIYVMNLPDISRSPVGIDIAHGNYFLLKLLKWFCAGYNRFLGLGIGIGGAFRCEGDRC